MNTRIWKHSELASSLAQHEGKRIVLVGGCFDVLHYGHIVFLQKAKQEGTMLIIALESDQFIKIRKKREPIHTQEERAYILSYLIMVDAVILLPYFDRDDQYNTLVQTIAPVTIAVTEGDTSIDKKRKHIESTGGTVKVVSPLLPTFSTSIILERNT
jgi:FAD synthetase